MSDAVTTDTPVERQGSVLVRYGEQLALPVAWLAMIVFFSVMEPDLFPTTRNLGSVLGTQTALFIIALAALLPAMAGDLDLSLGWTGALGAMVMAVLNNGLSLLGVGADATQIIKGLVLLAAVAFDIYNKKQGKPSISGAIFNRFGGGRRRDPEPAATTTDTARQDTSGVIRTES